MANPANNAITTETPENLILDSAAVYKNYGVQGTETKIGVARGGASFVVETEYRDIPADGAPGSIKGFRRITKVTARISATIIQFSKEFIQTNLPGSSIADYPAAPAAKTHDEITRELSIALTDYADNITLVGKVSGSDKFVVCGIKNALADGNFELKTEDNNEAGTPIQFTAHFDPDNLSKEPWFIRYPVISEA